MIPSAVVHNSTDESSFASASLDKIRSNESPTRGGLELPAIPHWWKEVPCMVLLRGRQQQHRWQSRRRDLQSTSEKRGCRCCCSGTSELLSWRKIFQSGSFCVCAILRREHMFRKLEVDPMLQCAGTLWSSMKYRHCSTCEYTGNEWNWTTLEAMAFTVWWTIKKGGKCGEVLKTWTWDFRILIRVIHHSEITDFSK